MSFLFFEDVLKTLNRKLNYDAVVNYAGNSFMESSGELIRQYFPFNTKEPDGKPDHKQAMQGIANLFESAPVTIRHLSKEEGESEPWRRRGKKSQESNPIPQ